MSDRKIASRLRRLTARAAVPLATAGAMLALAPAAGAFTGTTYPSTVLTPGSSTASAAANGTALATDISSMTATGGFYVVQLCGCTYSPTTQLAIPANVDVEFTGPPLIQINAGNNASAPQVEVGYTGSTPNLNNDVFTTTTGDNVIFKGFTITGAAPGFAGLKTNGGNVELDNMSLYNELGNGMNVTGGTVNVYNSDFTDENSSATGSGAGIVQSAGTMNVVYSTIEQNSHFGIDSTTSYTLFNDVIANNPNGDCLGTPTADAGNLDDDGSCGGNSDVALSFTNPTFQGGPTRSIEITAEGSPGVDNVTNNCPAEDQRFFAASSTSSCNPGSYQSGTQSTEAQGANAPISCTVKSTTEISPGGTGSSTDVVAVTDPTSFLGPDTVLNATTNNGTIAWPVVSGTLFDAVSPLVTAWPDQSTPSEYDVTASKTAGDATAHDTTWSFTAMDWLGNTHACS